MAHPVTLAGLMDFVEKCSCDGAQDHARYASLDPYDKGTRGLERGPKCPRQERHQPELEEEDHGILETVRTFLPA